MEDSNNEKNYDHIEDYKVDDFLVLGLENVEPSYSQFDGKMYAGRIPVEHDGTGTNEDDKNGKPDTGRRIGKTMFWLFEPTTQEIPNTVVIWLNGGPGCSSFNCGVMMEHSPVTQPLHDAGYCCLKNSKPQLDYNEHTWTKLTTMLYIEHPWGTGFSYGLPEPKIESEASSDLYYFLQNFFTIFDHLADHDLYIFGESYAGMFVPSIMKYIHNANTKLLDSGDKTFGNGLVPNKHINLHGGAMGNGWIDPMIQGPATIDYSWWHGLIDQPTRDALHTLFEECIASGKGSGQHPLSTQKLPPFMHTFSVQDDCGMMWGILLASGHPNEYDITTFDANVDQVTFTSEEFYNSPAVKQALHAPTDHFWHGCQWGEGRRNRNLLQTNTTLASNPRMSMQQAIRKLYMDNDRPISMKYYMSELLDAGYPLLVYNGDRDMTTNMVGTELVLNQLDWHGKDHWLDAPRGLWNTNNYPSGWVKEYDNLIFAVVYNSGHMVSSSVCVLVPSFGLIALCSDVFSPSIY